uniref:Uncharacterized protein n=1 Tax=Arundo donax TaxID=35708 RepID=A0A0A9G042_ARUDO
MEIFRSIAIAARIIVSTGEWIQFAERASRQPDSWWLAI